MQNKFMDPKASDSFVYTTNYDIYTSLGKLKTIQWWKSKMASEPSRWVYVVTNEITILQIYLRILYGALIFDNSHRCVGYQQVKRCHRVAKFLRKRLLSACEV